MPRTLTPLLAIVAVAALGTSGALAQSSGNSGSGSGTDSSGQTGTSTDSSGSSTSGAGDDSPSSRDFGMDWSDDMNGTFFTDDSRSTLRSDDEIRTGLRGMNDTDRQMLRTACQNRQSAAGAGSTTATTGSTSATGRQISDANMMRICDLSNGS